MAGNKCKEILKLETTYIDNYIHRLKSRSFIPFNVLLFRRETSDIKYFTHMAQCISLGSFFK
jgi:hypothetical protein